MAIALRARFWIAAAIIFVGLGCSSKLPLPTDPSELARLLENPNERDRAACRLLELQRIGRKLDMPKKYGRV